jgi:type VI protein secretion system component Hcp
MFATKSDLVPEHADVVAKRKRYLRRSLRVAVPALLAVGVGGAYAAGQSSTAPAVINACYATKGSEKGLLRIDVRCRKGERSIKWNQKGLRGLPGVNGTDGSDGAPGLNGVQGLPGIAGPAGATGATGEAGADGRTFNAMPKCQHGVEFGDANGASMHLRLADIVGDSTDPGFKDQSTVYGFCFGGTTAVSSGGAGSGTGRTTFTSFNVTKRLDRATTRVLDKVARGQHITDATFAVQRSGDKETFLEYAFKDLVVTGVTVRASGGSIFETTSFGWADANVTYTPSASEGGAPTTAALMGSCSYPAATDQCVGEVPAPFSAEHDRGYFQLNTVVGSAADGSHADALRVDDFCYGVAATYTTGTGALTGSAPSFSSFANGKQLDRTTPLLLGKQSGGSHMTEMRFQVEREGVTGQVLDLRFKDVLVRTYAQGVGDGLLDEWIGLNYSTIDMTYRKPNPDGSPGAASRFTYDIAATKSF